MEINILVGLDKDGTIIRDKHYLGKNKNYIDNIELYPIAEGIRLLKNNGITVVVISNQSGVAQNYFDCDTLKKIDNEIDKKLKKQGAKIDAWYFCPYVGFDYAKRKEIKLPNKWVVENPKCRKPNTGMLKGACKNFGWELSETNIFVIGDNITDVQTAKNAGGKGYLVNMEKNPEKFLMICKEICKK